MAMLSYDQARADHEYLWKTYGEAQDMSGGYVDQNDLRALMRLPTKATAMEVYCRQIEYWFQVGPDSALGDGWKTDPKVEEIALRHWQQDRLTFLRANHYII